MLCQILCSCGKSLADIYDAFCAYRNKRIGKHLFDKKLDISPDMMTISDDIKVELEEPLNELGVNMICCRMRLLTTVKFTELY